MPEQRMEPVETINALAAQGRIELPTPPRPPSLMDVIATAGVDKLPMLWELYERQQKMDAEKAFNQAMALVQEQMQPVLKETENTITKSRYAKLIHIDKAIRPIYSKVGFSLSFNGGPARSNSGVLVTCDLRHVGGHMKSYQLEGEIDNLGPKGSPTKTLIHGLGSTVSYLRRYLTVMIFNIPLADEDDDGNGERVEGEPGYRPAEGYAEGYRHGGWEGSGSQASADEAGRRRISELEQRQADLKAGRQPRTAEPPLEEGLQASVDQRQAEAPKTRSKNFKMLEAFGTLHKGFSAMNQEATYYDILAKWGRKKSNEFPDTPEGQKAALACYKKMGTVYGPMVAYWNRMVEIPADMHFATWDDVPPAVHENATEPIVVGDKMFQYSDEHGNWRVVE